MHSVIDDFFKPIKKFLDTYPLSPDASIVYGGTRRETRNNISVIPFKEIEILLKKF